MPQLHQMLLQSFMKPVAAEWQLASKKLIVAEQPTCRTFCCCSPETLPLQPLLA